jgi:ribonucleoside-diphosphate reductase alpha chain
MAEALVDSQSLGAKEGTRKSQLGLSENAERVLRARYLKKDEEGTCTESSTDLFRRVAKSVADAETRYDKDPEVRSRWEERFYSRMVSRQFMPNSPTLMNAGREMGMLSACFVLPVRDSINEIFDSIKHTALIQKAGGGTGFAFDELRPTGDYINSSGGTTSGPISFWRAFSEATNAIQQGAFRRGANMGMMYITHPDILKFLHAKQDLDQFNNYNISIKMTDEWMEGFLAEPGHIHVVKNPRTNRTYALPKNLDIWGYDLKSLVEIKPGDAELTGEFYTRQDMWDIIVNNAHATGEPGVVFIDKINHHNPTPHIGRMEATNPCGEQPLLPYEACNLGSINLERFLVNDDRGVCDVDWDSLREAIHDSTRFLDNIIDVNRYPLPEITEMCTNNRKIGLGVMGFADALYRLGVAYNSDEGVAWGERFMKFLNDESHNYSEQLAKERGSFPNWKGSTWDTKHNRPMRNATCTTVAPTGTISIISGCSGGIEPMFSLAFFRNVLKGQSEGQTPMVEINPIFEAVAKREGLFSEGFMEQIATEGTLAHMSEVPDKIKRVFVCAHDINPERHMQMQAAFQKHCDASISKTINFPETATVQEVESIYKMAFELDCKGVTVYRNGCRQHQPMALKDSDKKAAAAAAEAKEVETKKEYKPLEPAVLPEITSGIRVRQLTPFGNMHINITVDPATGRAMEVFAQLGKGGDIANSDLEAICRMISLWLRSGGSLQHVINQLQSIGSSLQVHTKDGKIMSLGDGIARGLRRYMRAKQDKGLVRLLIGDEAMETFKRNIADPDFDLDGETNGNGAGNGDGKGKNGNGTKPNGSEAATATLKRAANPVPSRMDALGIQWQQAQYKVLCPECQSSLRFSEGCVTCDSCGFSKC